jgi:hypothetical protein
MSVVYVEIENVLKINAGTACLDRSNEVEPRPNEGRKKTTSFSSYSILLIKNRLPNKTYFSLYTPAQKGVITTNLLIGKEIN